MRSKLGGAGGGAEAATFSPTKKGSPTAAGAEKAAEDRWEVRPGGMLVQKRDSSVNPPTAPVPAVRVKVKHGAVYHEIYISSQGTFGDLKKALSERTGLHPMDQKVIYKDKERDNAAFLDTAGVKDKSKLVVEEDPVAKAKRLLEERKAEKLEKAAKSIAAVSLEVDKLKSKVLALEAIVNKGGRVVDEDVNHLIELLMNQLLKLDVIVADGDVKTHKAMQVKRVQKYVEILDGIKVKNAVPRESTKAQPQPPAAAAATAATAPEGNYRKYQKPQTAQHSFKQQQQPEPVILQQQQQQKKKLEQPQVRGAKPTSVKTPAAEVSSSWDILDSLFSPPPPPSSSTPTSAATSTGSSTPTTRFDWELF